MPTTSSCCAEARNRAKAAWPDASVGGGQRLRFIPTSASGMRRDPAQLAGGCESREPRLGSTSSRDRLAGLPRWGARAAEDTTHDAPLRRAGLVQPAGPSRPSVSAGTPTESRMRDPPVRFGGRGYIPVPGRASLRRRRLRVAIPLRSDGSLRFGDRRAGAVAGCASPRRRRSGALQRNGTVGIRYGTDFVAGPSSWVGAQSAASARPPPTERMDLCWRWDRGPRG